MTLERLRIILQDNAASVFDTRKPDFVCRPQRSAAKINIVYRVSPSTLLPYLIDSETNEQRPDLIIANAHISMPLIDHKTHAKDHTRDELITVCSVLR